MNAFGFGGINAHVILEEYRQSEEADLPSHLLHWETEVCIVQGNTRQDLTEQLHRLQQYLQDAPQISLKDLAYTLNIELNQPYRVAIVASSVDDLRTKIERTLQRLSDPQRQQIKDRDGIYFFEQPLSQEGKLAFLFPGVGAAYSQHAVGFVPAFPRGQKLLRPGGSALYSSSAAIPVTQSDHLSPAGSFRTKNVRRCSNGSGKRTVSWRRSMPPTAHSSGS